MALKKKKNKNQISAEITSKNKEAMLSTLKILRLNVCISFILLYFL